MADNDMERDALTIPVITVDDDWPPPGSYLAQRDALTAAVRDLWRSTGIEPRLVWLLERANRLLTR